jgi:hypothetical protein
LLNEPTHITTRKDATEKTKEKKERDLKDIEISITTQSVSFKKFQQGKSNNTKKDHQW